MFGSAGKVFFGALRDAAERRLGRRHPCFLAIERAAQVSDPDATVAAQTALDALDPEVAAALMAEVHQTLHEDPAAVLGAWSDPAARH